MSGIQFQLNIISKRNADIPFQELLHGSLPDIPTNSIAVVCKLGNDSQMAANRLREIKLDEGNERHIVDMIGGLRRWSKDVDPMFPVY